ncbi:unnamed protein product [Hydatigera taeniaeformis]|uniref:USP domain-containing protein n=1 Tax=Hydatigena taeniaeformis TaxID=6205 RepID=A0A0R3X723_HYDTA|nr:unnamed protein product [Hydatigera taeniaeformis]
MKGLTTASSVLQIHSDSLKNSGSDRKVCVDCRQLNAEAKKEASVDSPQAVKLFSMLNLKSGCWQVAVVENAKEKYNFT